MKVPKQICYEFGSFRLDPSEHTLLHDGEVVPLTPKAFDTLLVLIEHRGHLVEKDELLEAVWADSFVEEANVTKHISILRRVLSANGMDGPIIDTVPKHGYRFVAPVRVARVETTREECAEISGEAKGATEALRDSPPGGIQQKTINKLGAFVILPMLLIGLAASGYYFLLNPTPPVLTDKDVILLIDFENKTGDEIFDGTLEQGLMMQLQQSPFLSLITEDQVRQTLKLMKRSPNGRVTKEIGREICQRQGLKALISGSLVRFDHTYSLTLEAINTRTGETIATTQVVAAGKDQVLSSLSIAATDLREKLGESLASIEQFDKPLPQATTASLEALKAYSTAREDRIDGKIDEAIALYKRALEIDPDFALAYFSLAHAFYINLQDGSGDSALKKAYELRGEVSEREKLAIEAAYHGLYLGDLRKRIEYLKIAVQTYPREGGWRNNLAASYNQIGQYEDAVVEAKEAIRIDPKSYASYGNLSRAYIRLNRFGDAKKVLKSAQQHHLDFFKWHEDQLYAIAFAEDDSKEMQKQIDYFKGLPNEHLGLYMSAEAAEYRGQWTISSDLYDRAINIFLQRGQEDVGAVYVAGKALTAAEFKKCRQARISANRALAFEHTRSEGYTLLNAAHALVICGELARPQLLMKERASKFPRDTYFNEMWLPVFEAQVALQKGDAEEVIKILEIPDEYDWAAQFYPPYIRGLAFLRLDQNDKSRKEFQKILDHRGVSPFSSLYPLAQLGKARAMKDKREYEKFFEMWKDADPDLPILIEARKEYKKL